MEFPDLAKLKSIFEQELIKDIERRRGTCGFNSRRLNEAITYALLTPGKRLRPLLVLASACANEKMNNALAPVRLAMPAALAIEYIHTYSLIHDDLPAMDDDDFRRGRLSLHRRFDEALAILAGDALLADAFYLASFSKHNAPSIIRELALSAGSLGLAAGQSEDLNPKNKEASLSVWLRINQAKTARLFEAAAVVGALTFGADYDDLVLFRDFGQAFGLAFQIQDDIDDRTGLAVKDPQEHLNLLRNHCEHAEQIAKRLPYHQNLLALIHLILASCS